MMRLYRKIKDNHLKKIYICNMKIYEKDLKKKYIFDFIKKNDINKFNTVHIIVTNMGEAVIFALTYKLWWKGGLVVGIKNYHKEIFKMLAPEVPVIIDKNLFLSEDRVYKGIKFLHVLHPMSLQKTNLENIHFFHAWQDYLSVNLYQYIYMKPTISKQIEQIVINKLARYSINLDKCVFISKEALSQSQIGSFFWDDIVFTLRKKGYSIFYNEQNFKGEMFFSIEEAYFIASKAKAIIALRSGLIDLLCLLDTPLYVIYSEYKPLVDFQSVYTLKQYPFISDKVYEFNLFKEDENSIKNKILQSILNNVIF